MTDAETTETNLQTLERKLLAAWELERKAEAANDEDALDAALQSALDCAKAIIEEPAQTVADFRTKALAVSWYYRGDEITIFPEGMCGTDTLLVMSILNGLLAAT